MTNDLYCRRCGELMDVSLYLGGGGYADELAYIYTCPACGYKEVRGWAYADDDASEYPVIAPATDAAPPDDDIPF